tara:strand:- start:1032 stop:1196 length:165 start_codon:yes stop_codon:yes gene_type:complete
MFILTISEWIANLFILSISLFLMLLSCLILVILLDGFTKWAEKKYKQIKIGSVK